MSVETAITLGMTGTTFLLAYLAFRFDTGEETEKATIALKMWFSSLSLFFGMGTTFVVQKLARENAYSGIGNAMDGFMMAWVVTIMVYVIYLFLMVIEQSIRKSVWDEIKGRLTLNG